MKTRMFMLALVAAALQTSMTAQTVSNATWKVGDARMRVQQGDRFNEARVVLQFEAESVVIRLTDALNNGEAEVLKQLSYAEIDNAEYSGRGADLPGLSVLENGQQRELTIRCGDDITILRLHKRYEKRVRQELTRRSGVRVEKSPYMSRGSFHWPAAI
ncbi:MAG: hypothetical protein O2968_18520 [Acidobacteria bacterium]|nr:hypothetical protein [Acidobacteriota bacterium]